MPLSLTSARRVILATAALALAVAVPQVAAGATVPDEEITLDVVAVNGSGCPAGTADVRMQRDKTGFRIRYDAFEAVAGGSAGKTDFRKNCQIGVLVRVPQGLTFAIARAEYRGQAHLRSGVNALHSTNYYFQGSADNEYRDHKLTGPLSGRWSAADDTAVAELVYAPCGEQRILNINTELRIDHTSAEASGKTNSVSMRSTNGDVDTLFNFHWKRCS